MSVGESSGEGVKGESGRRRRKKVVLAYSGGLDTTVCIPLLREKYGFEEVIAVTVDVGQPPAEIERAKERASNLCERHVVVDAKEEFVQYIFRAVKANANYEGYVLGTALSRPLIARKVLEVAAYEDADAVAHGCTGKGNDQLRFDAVFRTSRFELVAPIRDLNLTRAEERAYAEEHGIPCEEQHRFSIDENLWSRSIEGSELENPEFQPPEEIFRWTKSPEDAPAEPEIIEIGFERGIPVSLNGTRMDGVSLIRTLNEIGGLHGVGRTDIIEDRVLGFKSREIYEHPAATILLSAHADLERLVLTRAELQFKSIVDAVWSDLVYKGLTVDPLYDALNAFIDKTQERVSGSVFVKLHRGNAIVVGRKSPHALFTKEVSFDAKTEQKMAEGFSFYHALQARIKAKMCNFFPTL
ncbi:MAG: Argininosuccinate synthase [Methanophagales archaeon]|nr:argininosuccinate synthase [Methanophagales archaeon]MCU4140558.1 Argininosuccinate synthase [Methanophagales archaeon]